MNVLIFLTYGISLKNWHESGLLSRELELYNVMSRKYNIKFTLVSYGDAKDREFLKGFKGINVIPVYEYVKKGNFKYIDIIKSTYIPFLIKFKIKLKFDLIKTNQLWGAWIAIVLKLISFKPLFIRTGYDIYKFSVFEKKPIYKRYFYYLLTQVGLLFCNLYSVSSKNDFDFIRKHYLFSNSKLALRPNWVKIDEQFSKKARKNKILMVGRLEKQKNFDFVIEKVRNSDLFIDIYGEGSLSEQLKREATGVNNISFMGRVDNSELLETYKQYKIYLSVSDYEGNSKTILEAMGAGCVVIANNIPNNIEIIDNNITGILFEKEQDNLIEIIKNLLSKPEQCHNISLNAFHKIKKNNSLKNFSDKEYKDYSNLINY